MEHRAKLSHGRQELSAVEREIRGLVQAIKDGVSASAPRLKQGISFALDDGVILLWLLLQAVLVGWPVLTGGYQSYLDNAVHLAEIDSLARGEAWSDIAFCGFPLAYLHSPLWYGAVARLVRAGMPAGPVYAGCLLVSFWLPGACTYFFLRRRTNHFSASAVAFLFMIQGPSIAGFSSAWGGMWTFFFAAGFLLLLWDRFAADERAVFDSGRNGVLIVAILLTHNYASIAMLLSGLFHFGSNALYRRWRVILFDLLAFSLGVVAAAVYWLPTLIARESLLVQAQNLEPGQLGRMLIGTTEVLAPLPFQLPPLALPQQLLLALGVAGAFMMVKKGREKNLRFALPYTGALLALLFLALPTTDRTWLGPNSWRFLYFVRMGFLICAAPFVSWLSAVLARRVLPSSARIRSWLIAAALLSSFVVSWRCGAPLRSAVATASDLSEVDGLWSWLRDQDHRDWGRVYLQDTFYSDENSRLSYTHVLALTHARTGVSQLGPYYGIIPFRGAWTLSEFATLFGDLNIDSSTLLSRLESSHSTHLIVSDERARHLAESCPDLEALHRVGRFSVYRLKNRPNGWVSSTAHVAIDSFQYRAGSIRFDADSRGDAEEVIIKVNNYPFWQISPASLSLGTTSSGFMRVSLPRGKNRVDLRFVPPRYPIWISLFGMVGLSLCLTWRRLNAGRSIKTP